MSSNNELDWDRLMADCIDFARRLIQTPSMTYEEEGLSNLVVHELERIGVDEVGIDGIGNVSGVIRGQHSHLGAIVLNSHLDHVDPGDLDLWSVSPYSAVIRNGHIIGRGASDIKGPLAVQVYSMAALSRMGVRPRRDIVFSGVVQEEIGGAGAVYWAKNLDFDVGLILLGEPSSNQISLGHRGILQMWVTFYGQSGHASLAEAANNPNYALVRFLNRLYQSRSDLGSHPILGETTVSPTVIEVDTQSMNVTPAWSRVLLDFRTATESPNDIKHFVGDLATDLDFRMSDAWATKPNTPIKDSNDVIYGFYTPPENESVQSVLKLVTEGMGWEPGLTSYQFATDGRHFTPLEVPIVGYSPGEERLAHTVDERISVEMMAESLRGHVQLLLEF